MDRHVKILGWFYIVCGIFIGVIMLIGHVVFFGQLNEILNSAVSSELTLSQLYELYFGFFAKYGITQFRLLNSVLSVISWLAFGIGILWYREWARLLGLVIVGAALLFSTSDLLHFGPGIVTVLQIALCIYSFWVLLSKEVTQKCAAILK